LKLRGNVLIGPIGLDKLTTLRTNKISIFKTIM